MLLIAFRCFCGDGVHHAAGDLKADPRERFVIKEFEEAVELLAGFRGELSVLRDGGADRDLGVLTPSQQSLDCSEEAFDVRLARSLYLFDRC
jgi:hypothetical protein